MYRSDGEFVSALQTHLGPALQVVAERRDGTYELLYAREDVADQFVPEDFDRLHRASLLAPEAREDAENVFRMGSLNVGMYAFDAGIALEFPKGNGALFVVFDDAEVGLLSVVETCTEWVGREV